MSVVNNIFVQSEKALLSSGHADIVVFTSGVCVGQQFRTRIDARMSIAFDALLGIDERESTTLRVLPDEFPNYLDVREGDELVVVTFNTENGMLWKVLDRELTPATVTVDFKLERMNNNVLLVFNPNTGAYFLANENGVPITDGQGNNIIVQI